MAAASRTANKVQPGYDSEARRQDLHGCINWKRKKLSWQGGMDNTAQEPGAQPEWNGAGNVPGAGLSPASRFPNRAVESGTGAVQRGMDVHSLTRPAMPDA